VALDTARQSASTIGALVALANGASLVGAALAARVPPRWSARTVLGGIVVTGVATALTAALAWNAGLSAVVLLLSGIAAGAIQVLGQATAAESVHPEERGDAIAVTGTFRAAALFAAPLAVAGLVAVVPLAPAVALVGAAIAVPAIGLRHRTRLPESS
jgi:MFS family permease